MSLLLPLYQSVLTLEPLVHNLLVAPHYLSFTGARGHLMPYLTVWALEQGLLHHPEHSRVSRSNDIVCLDRSHWWLFFVALSRGGKPAVPRLQQAVCVVESSRRFVIIVLHMSSMPGVCSAPLSCVLRTRGL